MRPSAVRYTCRDLVTDPWMSKVFFVSFEYTPLDCRQKMTRHIFKPRIKRQMLAHSSQEISDKGEGKPALEGRGRNT